MSDIFIFTQQRQRLQAYCLRNISSVKGHSHNQINFYVSLGVCGKNSGRSVEKKSECHELFMDLCLINAYTDKSDLLNWAQQWL